MILLSRPINDFFIVKFLKRFLGKEKRNKKQIFLFMFVEIILKL